MARCFAVHLRFPADTAQASALQDLAAGLLDTVSLTGVEEHEDGWRVYFRSAPDRDRALQAFQNTFARQPVLVGAFEMVAEDWAARTQAHFEAVRVDRIIVAPPWNVRTAPDATTIIIRPSMGFGTGHHASTRLCLRLLQTTDVNGRSVLDIGTGSGVLVLAAIQCGASSALGIDNDPDAIASAQDNLLLNPTRAVIDFQVADVEGFDAGPFDVVIANLTGPHLLAHIGTTNRLVRAEGVLIASGILEEEESTLRTAFAHDHIVLSRIVEDGWVALQLAPRKE